MGGLATLPEPWLDPAPQLAFFFVPQNPSNSVVKMTLKCSNLLINCTVSIKWCTA